MSINKIVIQDMNDNRVLAEYEGETFISSLAFSGNKEVVALCRTIGYTTRPDKDKLIIFDLAQKKIIFTGTFTCSGAKLALSHNGSQLAVQHSYLKNPTDSTYSGRVLISNTQPPYDKKYVVVEATSYAIAFSPDDTLLVVACAERDICVFEVATRNQISQRKAHSDIKNIAFSPDGNLLALYSEWGLQSLWTISPSSQSK